MPLLHRFPASGPTASLALASALLLAATPALAQDEPAPDTTGPGLTGDWAVVGIGAGILPQYEGSRSYDFYPVPGAVGSLGGVSFQFLGTSASATILSPRLSKRWQLALGPVANYGTNRTHLSYINDKRVRALGSVRRAIEVGGSLGLVGNGVITSAYDRLSVSVSYRKDVGGGHRGTLLKPSVTYLMPVSRKALVVLLAQADRADSRYASTYFSISPGQSTASTLPTFTARGGWKDWTVGGGASLAMTGDLTHGLALVGGVSYTRLINDFAASPVTSIAGSRNQWLGAVGLAYTF